MKQSKAFILVLFFTFKILLFSTSPVFAGKEISPYRNGDKVPVSKLLEQLSSGDRKNELAALNQMMKESEKETGFDRFLILRHYAKIQPDNNQYWLDSCIRFAVRFKFNTYLNTIYILKSSFFRAEYQYDSAMIYTLKARDESLRYNNIEQIANATHLLGDLYFGTGFYNQARKYYEEVQKIKGDLQVWKSWRERVIRNNMALIDFQQKDYLSGIKTFLFSRAELGIPQNRNDSLAVAYVISSLARGYFYNNQLQPSQLYLDSAILYNFALDEKSGLTENYLLQARLFLKENKAEQALQFYQRFTQLMPGSKLPPALELELLDFQSELAVKRGDIALAFEYQKLYSHLNDSLLKASKAAQILQLQTEHEYDGLHSQFKREKRDKYTYLIILFFTGVSLVLLTLQYIKIQNKNKRLVSLTLKTIPEKSSFSPVHEEEIPFTANNPEEADNSDLTDGVLFKKIMEVMENKKLFLQPTCSLENLSDLLGSNRTYISKAINTCYGQNFNAFINSLRVKEALQLIKDDAAQSLTIEAIAFKVGFRNRTSFISAFLKEVGMLPSSFISNLKEIRNIR